MKKPQSSILLKSASLCGVGRSPSYGAGLVTSCGLCAPLLKNKLTVSALAFLSFKGSKIL